MSNPIFKNTFDIIRAGVEGSYLENQRSQVIWSGSHVQKSLCIYLKIIFRSIRSKRSAVCSRTILERNMTRWWDCIYKRSTHLHMKINSRAQRWVINSDLSISMHETKYGFVGVTTAWQDRPHGCSTEMKTACPKETDLIEKESENGVWHGCNAQLQGILWIQI